MSTRTISYTRTGRAGFLAVCLFSGYIPCSTAFSQIDTKEFPKKSVPQPKAPNESEQFHAFVDTFNRYVEEGDWRKAGQVANEAAKKFGKEDSLVQNMLLTSINGERKLEGLAPIIVKIQSVDPKSEELQLLTVYSLKSFLPPELIERDRFAEILIECISATITEESSDKPAAKVRYSAENQGLIILARKSQHKLVVDILKRLGR